MNLLGTRRLSQPVLRKLGENSPRKTEGKVSPILVTLTSSSDSDFERSNISLEENIPGGVDPNCDGRDCCVRKNEGKILWFSAD